MYYIHVVMFLNRLRSLFSLLKPTVQGLSSPLYSPCQLMNDHSMISLFTLYCSLKAALLSP